jgi:hypothetical protein
MGYISIENYLKRGPKKSSLLNFEDFRTQDSVLVSNILSSFDLKNDIKNTGKSCRLMKSNHIDLIL